MTAREGTVAGFSLTLDGRGARGASTGDERTDRFLDLLLAAAGMDCSPAGDGGATARVLGQTLAQALGDKRGITRYAGALVPVGDALVAVSLDLSGRAYLVWDVPTADADGFLHGFLRDFTAAGGISMHVQALAPGSPESVFEAVGAAVGRALGQAIAHDPRETGVPSSKGVL